MEPMTGHLFVNGRAIARGGFMPDGFGPAGFVAGESMPMDRAARFSPQTQALIARLSEAGIERADIQADPQILQQLGISLSEFQRAITSTVTGFPVRENLEAEAKILVPLDTPVRNMLPRVPGSGLASLWRQITSLGGGYDAATATIDQPGSPQGKIRSFFSETGAPAEHTTVYAAKTASYKLLGTYGSITGFAQAGGSNFQQQRAMETTNSIRNTMLNEENALLNGDSSSVAAPWGDGTTTLAFDGLVNLITTGNGTPTAQVQTSVGGLTLNHIDNQLKRLWAQGAQQPYLLCAAQEILSLVHLAEASGSIIRVMASASADAPLGLGVSNYKHPITGELVPIIASRFLPAGTMLFMSKFLPDGTPTADVSVLPQVQLPALAPNESVQGYTAQELAPTTQAPQVYAWIVSVYEVLRLKSALHAGKSTGLTAV